MYISISQISLRRVFFVFLGDGFANFSQRRKLGRVLDSGSR